jgi:branched-chain amino acid transport system substrate-binding protein
MLYDGLRKKSRGLVMLMAAGSLALAGCGGDDAGGSGGGGESGGTQTLPYGLLVPLSGAAAAYGPPHRASVETAVKKINEEGGIKVGDTTYNLDLKVYDSAFDPTKAVSKAREAITKDGVDFLAVDGGVVTSAVQPVAESSNVAIFALAGGDKFLGEDHPLTFRYYYSIPDSLYSGLKVLKPKLGPDPKLVSLYPDDDVARSLAEQSKQRAEALGVSQTSAFVGRDVTDFNSVLTNVLKGDPDVIDFGVMPPSQYAIVVKQARQLGYKGHFIFDDTAYLDTVIKAAGKGSVTGSVSVPYLSDFTTPAGKYWSDNIASAEGGDPKQGWTTLAYDNVLLLKEGIEKAQSVDPQKVSEALREVSVEGALGEVSFGGEDEYGIPQVFEIKYPVAEITKDDQLKKVATVDPGAEL